MVKVGSLPIFTHMYTHRHFHWGYTCPLMPGVCMCGWECFGYAFLPLAAYCVLSWCGASIDLQGNGSLRRPRLCCGVHLRTARSLSLLWAGDKVGNSGDAEYRLPLYWFWYGWLSFQRACELRCLCTVCSGTVYTYLRIKGEFCVSELFFRA